MKRVALVLVFCLILSGCGWEDLLYSNKPFELSDLEWKELPDSTAFSRIGYSQRYHVLGVVFRNSDPRIYLYKDFPVGEWDAFVDASSWGGYYNSYIKGKYDCERIDNPGT